MNLSENTQAILLLTGALGTVGNGTVPLSTAEYKRLARFLKDRNREPADLVRPSIAPKVLSEVEREFDESRVRELLGRGFLLAQAFEEWTRRSIWVVSRADSVYPRRLKDRLREDAPPVLYGCGDTALLGGGGLAIVGSRDADARSLEFAEAVAAEAADSGHLVISGGARGVDQAAMFGAISAGGAGVEVLAEELMRASLLRERRNAISHGRLLAISPYDPLASFTVAHAMQRNKLIYALADAALVASATHGKGGTWAGATEQLEKLKFVPVFVRATGPREESLEALIRLGAMRWPEPHGSEFAALFRTLPSPPKKPIQRSIKFSEAGAGSNDVGAAERLFSLVRTLLRSLESPRTDAEVASELGVTVEQAREWLQRLVQEGVLEKIPRPTRYRATR